MTDFKFETVEEYLHQIENAEKMELHFRQEHERLVTECGNATQKLREELAAIQKPYQEQIEQTDKTIDACQKQKHEFRAELENFKNAQAVAIAQKAGKHSVESFTAFLRANGFGGYHEEFSHKKTLSNGVDVFRQFDEGSFMRLFFFKGTKLVAFWKKRQGQHPGDDTMGQGWCGETNLKIDNELQFVWNARLHLDNYDLKREERMMQHPFARIKDGEIVKRRFDPTSQMMMDFVEKQTEFAEISASHNKSTIMSNNRW